MRNNHGSLNSNPAEGMLSREKSNMMSRERSNLEAILMSRDKSLHSSGLPVDDTPIDDPVKLSSRASLNSNPDGKPARSARSIYINFLVMAVCFAINHGTVSASLSFATSVLGNQIGNTSSGVLFVLYALSALTIAAGIVQLAGPKWSLVSALFIYCFYVAAFLVAIKLEDPDMQWVAAIAGSAIGGIGAGWLWTAQGTFFARSAALYASATGTELSTANSAFAGVFSTIYVLFEVVCKAAATPLVRAGGNDLMFIVFTGLAMTSALCMMVVVEPVLDATPQGAKKFELLRKAKLATSLFARERKMQLLLFLQLAFGFTLAFVNGFLNNSVVPLSVDPKYSGLIFAITPAVATIVSLPMSFLASKIGKQPLMMFGASCYASLSLTVSLLNVDQLVNIHYGVCGFYVVQGLGRAVFENTNKAVFADFFPNDQEAAFANVIFQSGLASAFAFFVFPYLTKNEKGFTTFGFAVLAIFALMGAFHVHRVQQRDKDTARLLAESESADYAAPTTVITVAQQRQQRGSASGRKPSGAPPSGTTPSATSPANTPAAMTKNSVSWG